MKQITHMHTWFAVVQFFAFKSDINDDGRLVFERKRFTMQQKQQQHQQQQQQQHTAKMLVILI